MTIDKKPSQEASAVFDVANSYANMSRTGSMYGKLNMLLDMKIWILTEEKKLREEIEINEKEFLPNKKEVA
jgi:hypothetical protein